MRDGFGAALAGRRHRRIFGAVALALCLVGLLAFIHAGLPLPHLPAFLPAYSSAVIVTDLITASLLFSHAPLSGRRGLIWIGGAYLFSGTIAIAQMLVFPGVWSATGFFGAGPQSAVWLWVSWHGGFPLLVLISAVIEAWWTAPAASASTAPSLIMTGCVLGLVILLTVLVTQCQAWLPNLITDGHYLNLTHSVPGILVPLINVAALVAVLLGTRRGPVLDLGLTIAVLASLIDAVLTLRAGARFSLGWYVARAATTVTAFSVLAVYLREITALHARVIRLNRQLAEQAMMDVITGLFNRRHFNTQLDLTLREAARRRVSTSLLLIDIDHFKRYNDQYGHLAGDACLHQVGQAIRRALRRTDDVATRYGGEEFAVILPATGIADATTIAHRILDTVLALRIEHAASQSAAIVTVSIGVGTVPPGTSLEDIIRRADRALYAAKDAGRNQVSAETDVALAG